jgi:hypothetical protein
MNRAAVLVMAVVSMVPGTSARAQNGNGTPPVIDTAATHALTRMGAYLRSLKAFQITADVTTEEVLEDGQKVTLTNKVNLVAEKPNRLRVELTSDRKQRVLLFDGSNFTLYAPRQKFYAVVAAPSTINALATVLEEKYDLDLPLVDLFRWGTAELDMKDIRSAKDIGPSVVDGITCQHYAFRQDGLDWQVWVQRGEYPLPRKLVLTTLTDDARPQHTSEYTWNLAPSYNKESFAFVPAPNDKKIPIAEVTQLRDRNRDTGGSKQ